MNSNKKHGNKWENNDRNSNETKKTMYYYNDQIPKKRYFWQMGGNNKLLLSKSLNKIAASYKIKETRQTMKIDLQTTFHKKGIRKEHKCKLEQQLELKERIKKTSLLQDLSLHPRTVGEIRINSKENNCHHFRCLNCLLVLSLIVVPVIVGSFKVIS